MNLITLIILYLGIINSRHIAGVVNEGRFAGHLIENDTELVFMDEWTSDSLSCEDAKRILQGDCQFELFISYVLSNFDSI